MFLRYFFPRTLFEPKTVFKIGYPAGLRFGRGYQRLQKDHRIWVVKNASRLFVIYARAASTWGCTPDWKASEHKFKRSLRHGLGLRQRCINFGDSAPRPMDRLQSVARPHRARS